MAKSAGVGNTFKTAEVSLQPSGKLQFARVMPMEDATNFANGSGLLGKPGAEEVFVTLAEDMKGIKTVAESQKRLSLFVDPEGTVPRLSDDALLIFSIEDISNVGFRAPIEIAPPKGPRGHGFIPGGRTQGGAREFFFDQGKSIDLGATDIVIVPLKK